MELIGIFSSIVAGIAANAALLAWRSVRDWYAARMKLKIAEEKDFQNALASESLAALGNYLDKSLGQFLLSEYSQNNTIRKRVDLFVARLQEYVGSEEEVPPVPEKKPPEPARVERAFKDEELRLVEEKLVHGPTWDALASLRRLIEVRLRSLAKGKGIYLPKRVGAGKILQVLHRAEVVSPAVMDALRYAIDLANRGIHGHEVTDEEGNEALRQSWFALEELGLVKGVKTEHGQQ